MNRWAQGDGGVVSIGIAVSAPPAAATRSATRLLGNDVIRVAAAAAGASVDLVDLACQLVVSGGAKRGWQSDAACHSEGQDLFFIERGQSAKPAKAICGRCDVQAECLATAVLANDKQGIWGGLAVRQRHALRQVLAKQGILGVIGEERHLVWAEPGADVEPPQRAKRSAAKLAPRLHQLEAVRRVVEAFGEGEAAQIAMATGTGKTLVGVWSAEALGCASVVVLVPSRQLIGQTARVWEEHSDGPTRLVAVCGDAGELDIAVTTDPAELRAAAASAGDAGERLVVIATYQSSSVLTRSGVQFDLAIADEAHHLAGATDKAFAAIVRGEVPARRRLYMTATPRTSVRGVAGVEVRGMDDPVFGPRVYDLGLDEAVEQGLIADYRVIVAAVDAETFEHVSALLGDDLDPSLVAGAIAVVRAVERYDLSSVVSFHTRVERAASFAVLVGEVAETLDYGERPAGPGMAAWIDGPTSVRIRDRLLARLTVEGSWGVVSNAKALGEGVDLPSLDAVAICDPKNSEVEIAQAVGRALRRPGGSEKVGLVVLPVLLTGAEDPSDPLASIDRRSLEVVTGALRALRGFDSALAARLDSVREQVGRRGGVTDAFARRLAGSSFLHSRVDFDLPGGAAGALAHAMALEVVRETTSEWQERFGLLLAFVDEHGTSNMAQSTIIDTAGGPVPLGQWCGGQRNLRTRGILAPERAGALEALAGWTWTPGEDNWMETFEALRRYSESIGTSNFNQKLVFEGRRIGSFVNTARGSYKSGTLSATRIALFETLPGWLWDVRAEAWESHFVELQRFAAANGHARPSHGELVDSFDIGRWVSKQRVALRAGKLDGARIRALRALPGWVDDERVAMWEDGFAHLLAWVATHGSVPHQTAVAEDGHNVGAWVAKQRMRRTRTEILDAERIGRLEAVPGWMWAPRFELDTWGETCAVLERYAAEHGHARVPDKSSYEGVSLGAWVSLQRTEFRRGRLSNERANRLMDTPGWLWSGYESRFISGAEALRSFIEREGHVDVPRSHREDAFPLGQWLARVLAQYEANELSLERRSVLEAVTDRMRAGRAPVAA